MIHSEKLTEKLSKYTKFLMIFVVLFVTSCRTEADPPFSDSRGFIAAPKTFDEIVGDNFDFSNAKGEKFNFASLKGNVVVLAFSTTWCPNCPSVLRALDTLKNKITEKKIKNIKIIALNIGNENLYAVKDHYAQYGIVNLEAFNSVPGANHIDGVPACIVFDKKGSPVCGYLGWRDFTSDEFFDFLQELANRQEN